jgi:probable phosphoglycerate mutase
MPNVLLLRHGSTDVMTTHLCGRSPGISLNSAGRTQALALANRLEKLSALITSPIQRASETAAIIASRFGIEPVVMDAFAEFHVGEWQGKTFDELRADPSWKLFNSQRGDREVRAPGGESMYEVQQRTVASLKSVVAASDQDAVIGIVTHADVIRAALLWVACADLGHYDRFVIDPCSITELRCHAGYWRSQRVNDCAHLEHPAGANG